MEDEISLIDFLRVLARKRVLILGGTALVTALSVLYSLWLPRGYESKARILVIPKHKFTIRSDSKFITEEPDVDIETQLELFGSLEIARRVVNGLGLDKGEVPMTANSVLSSGRLEIVGATPVIELTVSSGTPDLSRDIANLWANEFIRYNEEVYSSENRSFTKHLKKNFEEVKNKIEVQRRKFFEFLKSNRKISKKNIEGREEMIILLQKKRVSLLESLNLFAMSYRDSWRLILDDAASSILRETLSLKKRWAENEAALKALQGSFTLVSGKKSSLPLEVKIPLSDNRAPDGSGQGQSGSRFFLASSTDPVAVKIKLDVLDTSVKNRGILADIEFLENSFPKVETIFSDIRKLDITAMESEEIVKVSSSLKKSLAPYFSVAGGLDIDYIYEDISNYIANRKMFDGVSSSLDTFLKEYNDAVLKSKSYELEFETLDDDYTTLSDSYISLGQKIEEYSLKEGVSTGNVKLIESAITPDGPSTPVKRRIVTLTLIFSLLFFILAGFLIDYYQREGGKINE